MCVTYKKDKWNTAVLVALPVIVVYAWRGGCRTGDEKVPTGQLLNLPNQHRPHGAWKFI